MNVAYVENDIAEDYLRSIRSNRIITTDMVDSNGKINCMVHQLGSQYVGIRSAINSLYIFQ